MGRVFIFCFYFQQFKNITQISSILLFWQTNNTIVFTLSTGRIVPLKISADETFLLPYRKKIAATPYFLRKKIKSNLLPNLSLDVPALQWNIVSLYLELWLPTLT
jgi:predicted ABC-type exoprotein transport system permease subunit